MGLMAWFYTFCSILKRNIQDINEVNEIKEYEVILSILCYSGECRALKGGEYHEVNKSIKVQVKLKRELKYNKRSQRAQEITKSKGTKFGD